MAFYVIRHAKAGSRGHWTGDDRIRPLKRKGEEQAEALIGTLARYRISAVYSSPYLRCSQTVEPLARARKLGVQKTASLSEGRGLEGLNKFFRDPKSDGSVLCTHGDIVWELVEDLVHRRLVKPGEGGYDKASTWVVDVEDGEPVKARYIPAP
jgi:broad specificity phosphatase PhoE